MAKEFDEAIRRIASARKDKAVISGKLYSERENIKRNQYLLDKALRHNQDGKKYQTAITTSRKDINSLMVEYRDAIKQETTLVTDATKQFGGIQGIVEEMNDSFPILFFPVRIEATFDHSDTYQLWVRVYPDEIMVETHEDQLTEDEIEQGQQYWRSCAEAPNDATTTQQAWDLICRSYGPERSAWIVLQNEPSNYPADPDALDFPDMNPPKEDAWTKQPVSKVMPDAFMVYAYDHSGNVVTAQMNNIPDELKMGIDPSLDTDDPNNPPSFTQDDDNDIVANDDVKWMIDFDAAIENGTGIKMDITEPQYSQGFAKILVLGVKSTINTEESRERLQNLINNHHYTDGFSLLKQGTATNNTDTEYSGYSSVDFGNNVTNHTERNGDLFTPTFTQRDKTDGQLLCEALGIDYDVLFHIFQSDGKDINNAMHINLALYQASVGYFANEFIRSDRRSNNRQLRNFFTDYVRARGALPSIRSGVQPYGILPTSVLSRLRWTDEPDANLYQNIHNITSALDSQFSAVLTQAESMQTRVAAAGGATQKLSDIMAQRPVSDSYVQRVGVGSGYTWNNLAYAAIEFSEKRQQWLSQQTNRIHQVISELGLELDPDSKILQVNYLKTQSNVDIPVVADKSTPENAPLPPVGGTKENMLQLLNALDFRELRDLNFKRLGVSDEIVQNELSKSLLFRFARQSLMLEYFEAACELLAIPMDQRYDPELVNILQTDGPPGEQGEMGRLSYGPSRLSIMERPFEGYATITDFLREGNWTEFPETNNLREAKESVNLLARVNVKELDLLTREVMDVTSYRLDTWRLSLINQRLNQIRGITNGSETRTMGLYLGAYGWLTNIKPNTELAPVAAPTDNFSGDILYDEKNKGYIHAPSINQAVTAAVLRSGYTNRATQNMVDPLSVNLSSERVRCAMDIMDAISNGQEINVLLGYELERRLHDQYNNMDKYIQALRDHYSQDNDIIENTPDNIQKVKARNVINGVKLIEAYNDGSGLSQILNNAGIDDPSDPKDNLQAEIDWIINLMDAIGDIAMSEGMFQIVQGNQVKGGAIMEALSKGKLLAEPDVINANKTGTAVTQRFTMHFGMETTLSNGWNFTLTARAQSEPYLNKWLSSLLPAPTQISCVVDVNDGDEQVPVTVRNIAVHAIDLMYLVNNELKDDDSMLSLYIKRYVRKAHGYTQETTLSIIYNQGSAYSFADILPVLLYARKLITGSRALNTLDYITPHEADGVIMDFDQTDLYTRATNARSKLNTAKNQLSTALNANPVNIQTLNNKLYALAAFGMEETIYEYYNDTDTVNEEKLIALGQSVRQQANEKLAKLNTINITAPATPADNQEYPKKIADYLKVIFGDAFMVLPKFHIRQAEQTMLNPAFTLSSTLLNDHSGNNLLTDEWLSSIARVRKNAAAYELLSYTASAINFDSFYNRPIKALQLPYSSAGDDRWLGASVTNTDFIQPGYVSIGASMPEDNTVTDWQAGLLVEEWIDVIPNREETTGVSFHHDQPNAKAPQCLILGLTPRITGSWQWQDLVDMMNETFDLAKKRGLDYEAIAQTPAAQVIPAMLTPAALNGNVIGLNQMLLTELKN